MFIGGNLTRAWTKDPDDELKHSFSKYSKAWIEKRKPLSSFDPSQHLPLILQHP
jgi:hypothetical protein